MPSIQRQKARLLLVCGQIRAAFARFWWEGARRRPVLQLGDPIGAKQDGGREGGNECKKICKQTETLRILGVGSRDGSADIWMFAIFICCLWDLFGGRAKRTEEPGVQKSLHTQSELSCMDGCFISCLSLTQQGQPLRRGYTLKKKNRSQKPYSDHETETFLCVTLIRVLSFTHNLSGIAHVYTLLMCNRNFVCLWLVQRTLYVVMTTIKLTNGYVFRSAHAVPYYEFQVFPVASCSSGSGTAGLCSSSHRKTDLSLHVHGCRCCCCCFCYCFVVTLHKLKFGVEGHKLLSLISV